MQGRKQATNVVRTSSLTPTSSSHSNTIPGCDNAINPPTQHVSDADCRMVCDVDHSQYCGNQDRVAVYRFTAAGSVPEGPGGCVSTDIGNFTLKAVDRNSLQDVVGLKAIVVEMVRGVVWGILSVSFRPLMLSELNCREEPMLTWLSRRRARHVVQSGPLIRYKIQSSFLGQS